MRNTIKILLVAILFLLLIIFLALLDSHYLTNPFGSTAFNKEKWIEAERGKTDQEQLELDAKCIRGAMIADLKKNYFKEATTQTDIITLLGETKSVEDKNGQTCLQYNLGMCSGLKVDYDSLNICFKNNVFLQANTVQN